MAVIRMGLRLLETLTSALYEDPIILFREYVQNSVDAYNRARNDDPSKEFDGFYIDISINKELKNITITDNGYGIPENDFNIKMTSIGDSDKSKYGDQIGFRGIGRLSGMPFCDKLIFTNKPAGSNKYFVFSWDGNRFHELLNSEEDHELEAAIGLISDSSDKNYDGNSNDHFFKVEILGYKEEIIELANSQDFEYRLSMMLPLKYHPEFTSKELIKDKYLKEMGESLDKYSFVVKCNDNYLYKPYRESNILESGIYFWPLIRKSPSKGIPGEKMGILWFTFNRKVTANSNSEPYGILVRSKNMLMGNNNALANAIEKNKDDYITTYRELSQTLQGVYGEMLINSPSLNDNARRDWFKIDTASIELRDIISNFMKHLYEYRKIASKAFNEIEKDKNKEKLTKAFTELTSNYQPESFVNDFYKQKDQQKADQPESIFEYADEDIPYSSVTIKRFYDKLAKGIKEFYLNRDDLQEFLKLRAYIKKYMNKES
jgi:hypothetical protein